MFEPAGSASAIPGRPACAPVLFELVAAEPIRPPGVGNRVVGHRTGGIA